VSAGLPDFLVIGAPKSGTTSVYRYLEGHPEVLLSEPKEPRYFAFPDTPPRFVGPGARKLNREIIWRESDYRELFAGRQPQHRAAGEASVTYLWAPGAADRIAGTIPHARLVAILRQPVDRAFSHFCHNRAARREPLESFADALAAEPERRRRRYSFNLYYVERGLYAEQLARYLRVFPREQLLVLLYDDLVGDPTGVMTRIAEHIGVTSEFRFDPSVRHNERRGRPRTWLAHRILSSHGAGSLRLKGAVPYRVRKALIRAAASRVDPPPELDPGLRATLTSRFVPDLRQLENLIDRDLSHWIPNRDAGGEIVAAQSGRS
jgi:hypothetical protein